MRPSTLTSPNRDRSWMDGALIVYDADTFEEVKRVSMRKPVGKYNVYNKISRSSGTSH